MPPPHKFPYLLICGIRSLNTNYPYFLDKIS